MTTTRVLEVAFRGSREVVSRSLYQYDYGQTLRVTDLTLPAAYEAHFARTRGGQSVTQVGTAEGVPIPNEMLRLPGGFFCWFFLHEGGNDGETRYEVRIPLIRRAEPASDEPTPEEQSAISEAIAALNDAVTQTGWDVVAAEAAADAAETAQGRAETAQYSAEADAIKAEGYAVGTQDGAEVQPGSPYYQNNAEYYCREANGYRAEASASAGVAISAKDRAETAAERAEMAATNAGFFDLDIVQGRLIYIRTDEIDTDFRIDERGHLLWEVG